MPENGPRIILTIGDPAGIGPEIAAALIEGGPQEREGVLFAGSARALAENLSSGPAGDMTVVPAADVVEGWRVPEGIVVIDTEGAMEIPRGGPSREGGLVAGRAIEKAAELALRGVVDGIVTGPVSKEGLRLAGYPWNGHTSMLADLMDSPDCQMMMVSGAMRIVILTRDIPLRDVPAAVTAQRVITGAQVTAAALGRFWGLDHPRILVAALNPHAGDGGVTGTEEIEIITPAIERLRTGGLDVRGPVPADTLFCEWKAAEADAIIALYHDQGMIPFKMGGFETGVNMTTGLPVVRTSVCHGTAYDIAGTGCADPGSLQSALALARECAAVAGRTA